jgi:hypothetical protein
MRDSFLNIVGMELHNEDPDQREEEFEAHVAQVKGFVRG